MTRKRLGHKFDFSPLARIAFLIFVILGVAMRLSFVIVFKFLSIFDNAETHDLTIESSSDIFILTSLSLVFKFAIAVLAFLTFA